MTGRINPYRCSHCGCDEPILGVDGKLYCDNCGMRLEKLEGGLTMAENKTLGAWDIGEPEKFELGKYYKHNAGKKIYICGICSTATYGMCLMGETDQGDFYGVSNDKYATVNWHEISKEEFLNGRK